MKLNQDAELVMSLLIVLAALAMLARRVRVPYPVLFVLGGLLLALVPGLPMVELAPDLVFLLFLPPLIYVAAVFIPLRDVRAYPRPITLLAVGLVLVMTAAVAVVAHAVVEGLSWPSSSGSRGRWPSSRPGSSSAGRSSPDCRPARACRRPPFGRC